MTRWGSRSLPYFATLVLMLGIVVGLFDLMDWNEDTRAAPLPDRTPPASQFETDAFLVFQCENAFETCAQQIAEEYCRKRSGALLWWRAAPEPAAAGNVGHSYRLTEINCRQ